jgi:SAM-dependent methyltransferase
MSLRDLHRLYLRTVLPQPWLVRRFIKRCAPAKGIGACLEIGSGSAPFEASIRAHWRPARYLHTDRFPGDKTDITADATALPVPGSSIDLIAGFQVLQHVSNAPAVLDEAARALSPGGHLLVTFPFMYGECDVLDFRRWTIEGMVHDCEAAGFELVVEQRIGGLFFMLTSMVISLIARILTGRRRSWRAAESGSGLLRIAIITALTFPFHLLGWIALFVDRLLPQAPCYMGGMILFRKTGQ